MVFEPCHSYIPTICLVIVSQHCFTPYHLRKNIVKNWIQLHACAQDIYCLDQEVFENLDAEKASGPVLTRVCNLMSYLTTGHYPSQVKCWKESYIIKLLNVITPNAKLMPFFTKEMGLVKLQPMKIYSCGGMQGNQLRHTYQRP